MFWQAERPNLRRMLIDPETCNARAIHVYRQVGFSPLQGVEHEGKRLALHALDLR